MRFAPALLGLLALPLAGTALRAQAAPPTASVRIEQSFGLAGVEWWAEITRRGSAVDGVMWVQSGDVNRDFVRRAFGCRPRRWKDADGESWRCRAPFTRGEPDWAELLRSLEAAGVAAPPPATDLSATVDSIGGHPVMRRTFCSDGSPWATTWRGGSRDSVVTPQGCGTLSPARREFEARVTQVIDSLRVARTPEAPEARKSR